MASFGSIRVDRPPPRLYRTARLFRRLSTVVLVVALVFVASVVYSGAELARSSPQTGGYTAGFAANDTVSVSGSLVLSNPGFYPMNGLSFEFHVLNASGGPLGDARSAPFDLAPGATTALPLELYLPISASGPAASLLVRDQTLHVELWGNATYAYLFPISVHFEQNRSWGAPFSGFSATLGAPASVNGSVAVPVTIDFSNHAPDPEPGALDVLVLSSTGASCGGATFSFGSAPGVTPGASYSQTQTVAIAAGCSLQGGTIVATYVGPLASIPLPPEAIP